MSTDAGKWWPRLRDLALYLAILLGAWGTRDWVVGGLDLRDHAGAAVSCAGDVDGDGLDDVVLGSYGGPDRNGAAYIIKGGVARGAR